MTTENDLRKLPIAEAYFFKFGSLPINRYTFLKNYSDRCDWGAMEKYSAEFDAKFAEKLEEIFNDYSGVLSFKKIDEEKIEKLDPSLDLERREFVSRFTGKSYHLKLILPERKQKLYQEECGYFGSFDADTSENFTIAYDGVNYIYYRKCKLFKSTYAGAQDAREELIKILSPYFSLVHTAPNPIREDFILIVTKEKTNRRAVEKINGTFYFFIDKSEDVADFFAFLLDIESLSLKWFYEASYLARKLDDINENFCEEYSTIFGLISRLRSSFWKGQLTKEINSKFSLLYKRIGDYVTTKEKLQEAKKLFYDTSDASFLKVAYEDLKKDFQHSELTYDALLNTLQPIRFHLEDYRNTKHMLYTAFFSIVSAIIGVIFYAIFIGKSA